MKLRFWMAEQTEDNACYNPIAKTKKEVEAMIDKNDYIKYTSIKHIEVDYTSAFDLFDWVTGESGGRNGSYTVLKEYFLIS